MMFNPVSLLWSSYAEVRAEQRRELGIVEESPPEISAVDKVRHIRPMCELAEYKKSLSPGIKRWLSLVNEVLFSLRDKMSHCL